MCAARSEEEPAERADPDLDKLLTHVARGDQVAFEALYDQLAASAYGVIRRCSATRRRRKRHPGSSARGLADRVPLRPGTG